MEETLNTFWEKKIVFFRNKRKLTITYAVGGAGAQKEIGDRLLKVLKKNFVVEK